MSLFVENYKYGCHLDNHCHLGQEFVSFAVPFAIEHDGCEPLLPPKVKDRSSTIKISKFCKPIKKTTSGTKIYNLNGKHFNNLFYKLALCENVISSNHINLNAKDKDIDEYIVKVTPARAWRDVHTSMKELYMTDAIYRSMYLSCQGSNIACKPFFGCLFWSGKKWKYVSVYEKAHGFTLSTMNKHRYLNREYNKEQILLSVSNAIRTLWILGYAHNDLWYANVVYDFKTHTTKIIDFEMAVKLPEDVTNTFRNILYPKTANAVKINQTYCDKVAQMFENNAKEMAISILSLATPSCHVNTDEDGFIYNTDEYFLPVLYEALS